MENYARALGMVCALLTGELKISESMLECVKKVDACVQDKYDKSNKKIKKEDLGFWILMMTNECSNK